MKRIYFYTILSFIAICVYADYDIIPTEYKEVCQIGLPDWKSDNHEDGTQSNKTYQFYAEKGDELSFTYFTSSEENCDKLGVNLDGNYVLITSGEGITGSKKIELESTGNHILKVMYAKDWMGTMGEDYASVSQIKVSRKLWSTGKIELEDMKYSVGNITNSSSSFSTSINVLGEDDIIHCTVTAKSGYNGACISINGDPINKQSVDGVQGWSNSNKGAHEKILPEMPEGIYTLNVNSRHPYAYKYFVTITFDSITTYNYHPELDKIEFEDQSSSLISTVRYDNIRVAEMDYKRYFSNSNWQSFFLPYPIDYNTLKNDFDIAAINMFHQYDDDEDGMFDRIDMEVKAIKSGTLKPNHPYLIRAKVPGEKTISISNAILYETQENSFEVNSMENTYTFTGTYHTIPGTEMVANNYYAMGGGTLHKADDEAYGLGAFRWYLKIESRDGQVIENYPNEVRIKVFGFDDDITGIEETEAENHDYKTYDLNGREISVNIRPGIYIRNGKKIIVK